MGMRAVTLRGLASLALATLLAAPAWAGEPTLTLEGMTFVGTRREQTEILVEAERAELDPKEDVAHLTTVHARLSGDDGTRGLDLRCQRGRFQLATSDFTAEGDVRGVFADGRRFRGPTLVYEAERDMAWTNDPVEIVDGGQIFRGGGFRYWVKTGRLRLVSGAGVVEAP